MHIPMHLLREKYSPWVIIYIIKFWDIDIDSFSKGEYSNSTSWES